MEVHRGEVFYADLSPVVGSEQGGIRPVLIIQNEIGNRHSPTVIAAAPTMGRFFCPRLPGVNDALTFVHNHFTDAVDFVGHFGPAEIL